MAITFWLNCRLNHERLVLKLEICGQSLPGSITDRRKTEPTCRETCRVVAIGKAKNYRAA
jgi:hypothetical protein